MIRWFGVPTMAAVLAVTVGASAHDWYTGLKDERGLDCCGGRDCAPVAPEDLRWVDGRPEIRIGGEWWPVPESAFLRAPSPDGLVHACKIASESFVRCVIWPGQS